MRVAWGTDIHLNFVSTERARRFCDEVRNSGAEALWLGGDIAEALDLEEWLRFLAEHVRRPIQFVLGNHDYYASDVATVNARMSALKAKWLHFLSGAEPVALTSNAGLVGEGGWGDARHGDFLRSPVVFSDYVLIQDLRECAGSDDPLAVLSDRPALQRRLGQLGDAAARQLRPALLGAVGRFREVYVLTHVPPFREAAWYKGRLSDDDWLPGVTCKAIGDLLLEVAQTRPETRITVLCGHTHGDGEATILPNLRVFTQGAAYCDPGFRVLEIG